MEIINRREEHKVSKRCSCVNCKTELLINREDLLPFSYQFKCPVCGWSNLWTTEIDKKIIKEIESARDHIISTLKYDLPKKYHETIKSLIDLRFRGLSMYFIVNNYYNKEAE